MPCRSPPFHPSVSACPWVSSPCPTKTTSPSKSPAKRNNLLVGFHKIPANIKFHQHVFFWQCIMFFSVKYNTVKRSHVIQSDQTLTPSRRSRLQPLSSGHVYTISKRSQTRRIAKGLVILLFLFLNSQDCRFKVRIVPLPFAVKLSRLRMIV